jgi:hypothetical protein
MRLPPFHSVGEPEGHFFALAYVPGTYGSPAAFPDNTAFHVLQFSLSPGFTHFSFSTLGGADGQFRAYGRGTEELSTPEFAVLHSAMQGIPPHAWKLYPLAEVDWTAFETDPPARRAYEEARRRLAHVLRIARIHARIGKRFSRSGHRVSRERGELGHCDGSYTRR